MKLSYVFQLKEFSIILGIGFLLGIFYGILNIPNRIKKRLYLQIICDIFFCLTYTSCLILFINIINLGEYRLFLIAGYIIGFALERITLGKIFAKGYVNVYNKMNKLYKKLKNSKIGKFVLK